MDRTLPISKPEWSEATCPGLRVTWLGHACVYTEIEGIAVLTDPMFSMRCSPVQWAGMKRLIAQKVMWVTISGYVMRERERESAQGGRREKIEDQNTRSR